MATKYAEFPVEETDKFIYGGTPTQGPSQVPTQAPAQVQTQPLVSGPVAPTAPPTAPVAKAPNASNLVKKVAEANKQLQEQMPAPEPQSATQNLVGDITKNWESLLPLAGIPAIAWLANKAFGGEGESGNRPKEPSKSIADRSIRKIEPTLETKPTATIEPTKNLSPQDAELLRKYEAQQAAKTQPPMMGQPGFQPSAPVAPPSVQALDQSFAASVAPPAVQTAPAAPVAPPAQPEPTETKKTGGRPPKQAIAPDEEKLTKGQQAMKKHLVSLYGNGPEALSAYNQVKDILGYTPEYPPGKGGSLQPEEKEKILQYRKENIAGPKINLTHEMKKTMKAGGGAAALMAIPGFANASSLKEVMGNIGEALIPMGMTASQLSPGTLYTPEEQREFARQTELRKQAERQKLGSPYRSVPPR